MKVLRQHFWMILLLGGVLALVPRHAIDPWGVFNPYKIIELILILSILQILGLLIMARFKGSAGALALGFMGGLISSTALTASLARQSRNSSENEARLLSLSYLSGLLGTLLESLIVVFVGLTKLHQELLWIFVGPVVMTVILVTWRMRSIQHIDFKDNQIMSVGVSSVLKLGTLIAIFLMFSKILQLVIGRYGQYVLTFLMCLFELQGPIIGNVQFFEAGVVDFTMLGNLLALGFLASYLAKWGLVMAVGSVGFKRRASRYTAFLIGALVVGWSAFNWFLD